MDDRKQAWDESYRHRDNFVFYPHEEVVRFVSRHVRKRVGLREFRDVVPCTPPPRILDLGCGIGRHVIYCHEAGLEAHGVDLSEEAVATARQWAGSRGVPDPGKRILQGDARRLPWESATFDFALSHGVLDSMPYAIAREACRETARVLKKGGLFYADVVSGDDSGHAREYSGEELLETEHEKGTIQSYFNYSGVSALVDGLFDIVECLLLRREDVLAGSFTSRYHLVLRSKWSPQAAGRRA